MTRILSVFRLLKRVGFALLVFPVSPLLAGGIGGAYFIENVGQWEGDFQFKCEVGSTIYYVTPQGMTVDFREFTNFVGAAGVPPAPSRFDHSDHEPEPVSVRGHVVQIHYVIPPQSSGGARGGQAVGGRTLSHYSSYFMTADSSKWRSRVGHFENVVVPEVWPGIDIEYRADKQGVETIYHVKPGADPAQIQMEYLGLDQPLRIDANGALILATSLGEVKEQTPYSYQQQGRVQQKITSSVRLLGDNRIGLDLGEYDRAKELVIDPLLYSTYLGGGAEDNCTRVIPAPDGGVYVTGSTEALSGFPTTPGAYDETGLFVGRRLFCSHFGPNGEFIASTLLGEVQTSQNPNTEGGGGGYYDSTRTCIWIYGQALGSGWPLTPDAYDTTIDAFGDAFLLRLNEDLTTLQYCSYIGGNSADAATAMQIDNQGKLILTGDTYSTDFPVTPDAFFTERQENDFFLTIFNPVSNSIEFSTYFGGSDVDYAPPALCLGGGAIWFCTKTYSTDIPVTENAFQQTLADTNVQLGDVMIAGVCLNPPTIVYCTYVGGGGIDDPYSLTVSDSVLFIAGQTSSQNFPVSTGAFDTIGPIQHLADFNDGFVASLHWRTGNYRGTYIGGNAVDRVVKNNFQANEESVTLVGITSSSDFPITENAFHTTFNGELDGFVVKLNHELTDLLYGTYVGGTHIDQYNSAWIENEDSLWAVGFTLSIDFPTTPDALQPGDNGLTSGFVQHFAIDTTADTTDAADNEPLPTEFSLTAFPNPFNPTTTLSFTLPRATDVTVVIHDVLGREIDRHALGRLNTGSHEFTVGNSDWASGVYFATLKTPVHSTTAKLVMLK